MPAQKYAAKSRATAIGKSPPAGEWERAAPLRRAEGTPSRPEDEALRAALLHADLAPGLAAQAVERLSGRADREAFRVVLGELVAEMVRADPNLGRAPKRKPREATLSSRRIVALVGPPGSGKTTALVKLAVQYGLAARRPTLVISLDNLRIGAGEQLRSLAAIIGVGYQQMETSRALGQALEEYRNKDLILIDTPGYAPAELELAEDLAQLLSSHPEVDTHLVLAACTRRCDLQAAADRFRIFAPQKLLFTRLDEATSVGGVLSETIRSGIPLSFVAAGQRIPEDLEPANPKRLAERLADGVDRQLQTEILLSRSATA